MKTPHKHAELIKAWADGAQIQHWHSGLKIWLSIYPEKWYENTLYRIKPEPKPDVGIYMYAEPNWVTYSPIKHPDHNLKLTFDGETGKLKSAEVI